MVDQRIDGLLFMGAKASKALSDEFGWTTVMNVPEGKSALELYQKFLDNHGGKAPNEKLGQTVMNALRLAVEARKNEDKARTKAIGDLRTVYGSTWLVAASLYAAGITKPGDLETQKGTYLRKKAWEIFEEIFESTDISPDDAYEVFNGVLVMLAEKIEAPDGVGPPGKPNWP